MTDEPKLLGSSDPDTCQMTEELPIPGHLEQRLFHARANGSIRASGGDTIAAVERGCGARPIGRGAPVG
jgi:hypothetical protein